MSMTRTTDQDSRQSEPTRVYIRTIRSLRACTASRDQLCERHRSSVLHELVCAELVGGRSELGLLDEAHGNEVPEGRRSCCAPCEGGGRLVDDMHRELNRVLGAVCQHLAFREF